MTDLLHLARQLGGDIAGRDRVLCPGPGHSAQDRSMSVTLRSTAPDGFIVHSFSTDDWQRCRDYVRDRLGIGRFEPGYKPGPIATRFSHPVADTERIDRALAPWRETVPLPGTPGDAYLRRRGVAYSGDALRWHPSCPFGPGQRYGCLVGMVRNIISGEPQAIHRTALDQHGNKIDRKAMGPTAGGGIKLTDDEDVTLAVAIGEGIETTLSIRQFPDMSTMPIWSVLNKSGISTFPVFAGIETLWIAVDHDEAGIVAARRCAERWQAAGREVIMLAAQTFGTDLNDVVRRHA